jgi:hypothetical protein
MVYTQAGRGLVVAGKCTGVLVGLVGIGQILGSYVLVTEPTAVGNFFQRHFSRGWGYDSRMTHQRVGVLTHYSKFKPELCINPKTGDMDKASVDLYTARNIEGLHKELPVSMLVQGHIHLPKGVDLVKSVYNGGAPKGK